MFNKFSFKNYFKVSSLFLAMIFGFFLEFYLVLLNHYVNLSSHEDIFSFLNAAFPLISKKWIIVFFIMFFIIFTILLNPELKDRVLSFIYNHRFILAILTFLIAVLFQIHGSSINQLNISENSHNPIFGVSRPIRSDEYNVNTPFALSQYFNNFGYFSDIVRGVPTDMFISYGQPVLDIAVIFRPFHWGYLFLSPGYGLSFFWIGRLIALFMVSFEFGRIIANKNKKLALAYAVLVSFAPIVQWWFAVNMLVEMLVFGQLIILLTNYYMNSDDYKKKLLASLSFIVCAGGFLLSMYPAWEIPFGYLFLIMFIWIIFKNKNKFKITKKDIGLFAGIILILSISMIYVFLKSQVAITSIMNTVYPGGRLYYGGLDIFGSINPAFTYFKSVVAPLALDSLYIEVASTVFISFFPLGFIVFALMCFKQKKKDSLLLALLMLEIIFIVFMAYKLPSIFADLTMLKSTVEIRLISVIFFINLIMIIRALSIIKLHIFKYYKIVCMIIAILISAIGVFISFVPNNQIMAVQMIIVFLLYSLAFYFILASMFNKKYLKGFLASVIIISFLAGGLVNPVESGLDYYYNQDIIQKTASIVNENPNANWIVVSPLPIDEIIPVGAHTINSVNIYPNMELWSKLDPEGNFSHIYNRYAHIPVIIKSEGINTFNNYQPDVVEITFNKNELKDYNITYILTKLDLNDYSNENVTFVELYRDNNGNMIFEVR